MGGTLTSDRMSDAPAYCGPQPSFADLLASLHAERYTGPVTLHFIHGVPTVVEKPNPTQIRLRRT